MTEDKNITHNIREAIHREELSRPPMPKDLNARLMQRVEREVNCKPKRKRIIWPWIAAACVAAAIAVYLTPPREDARQVVEMEKPTIQKGVNAPERTEPALQPKQEAKHIAQVVEKKSFAAKPKSETLETAQEPSPEELATTDTSAPVSTVAEASMSSYTVSNPERLKYTPEEIAALKRQARRKYEEWLQLEREIIEYDNRNITALINEVEQ